jgi:dTDP-4-dehydrorhamnose 3,5-epimerase
LHKIDTNLDGVFELRPKIFKDARGFFLESYHQSRLADLGIHDNFVQDNQSSSIQHTLRGLHYQLNRAQAKLCRVVEGEALDVAVDIRLGSPNFGKCAAVRLTASGQNQIYIPAGFAHGFLVLTDRVTFLYKCSDYYFPEDEYGVAWNDPLLNIDWGITDSAPLLSAKDSQLPNLADIPRDLLPIYTPR